MSAGTRRPGGRDKFVPGAASALGFLAFASGAGVAALGGSALVIYLPWAAVGAILVAKQPGNRMGWLLTTIAWVIALGFLPVRASTDALQALTAPPLVLAVAWFKSSWTFPMTLNLIACLAIVFPTGRLPVGSWRRPAMLVLVALTTIASAAALWPLMSVQPDGLDHSILMPNPLRLAPPWLDDGSRAFPSVAGPIAFALMVASIVSLVVRYLRSDGVERLQLRWLVTGLAAVGIAVPLGFVLFAALGSTIEGVAWLPAIIAFTMPPIAVGIAVLRYRLYDIDRIISRTIGWGVLTGVLLAIFGLAVIGLQAFLAGVTQGETLAVAASTLVAFALFQPLRRRVQAAVDRRFDRARVDADLTVTAFADRLRSQIDLGGLEADIAGTVASALRPASTGVWIRGASR